MKRITLATLAMMLTALAAGAPVVRQEQQPTTLTAQVFSFTFAGLPSAGVDGRLFLTLNGDYGFAGETAAVQLDNSAGRLVVGDGTFANALVSNTIAGLTLNDFSYSQPGPDDVELRFVFNISDELLGSLLEDQTLHLSLTNDAGVAPRARSDPDFVRVGLRFDDAATVPEPNSLLLLAVAFAAFGGLRRRVGEPWNLSAAKARPAVASRSDDEGHGAMWT